jgi:hypothetical protein
MVIPTVFANFLDWGVLNRNQILLYKGNLNDIMYFAIDAITYSNCKYYSDTPFIYFI